MFEYQYPRAAITCDVCVFHQIGTDEEAVLLIQRKNEPYKGMFALPGGFLEMSETLRECASRELLEETGLELNSDDFVYINVYDAINRDKRSRVISHCFAINLKYRPTVMANDDAISVQWCPTWSWPLAFDHTEMISEARSKLLNV